MTHEQTHMRRANRFVLITGALCAALGLAVLAGWHTHNVALIQVRPEFVPMMYNTALAFFLSGVGLALVYFARRPLAMAAGAPVLTVGLLTLIEYTLNVNLGIDELLMRHCVTVEAVAPGRMAANTAFCFLLTGAALLVGGARRVRTRPLILGTIGSVVAAFGTAAILGYVTGIKSLLGLSSLTPMAAHTAVGLCVLGSGVMAVARRDRRAEDTGLPRWLPAPVFVFVLMGTLTLWHAVLSAQRTDIQRAIRFAATAMATDIAADMESRVRPLDRMARRMESAGGLPDERWEFDAGLYVRDDSAYQAIGWVDPSFHVRRVVPFGGNEAAFGLDLGAETRLRSALERARDTRETTVTRSVDLAPLSGRGFLVCVPVFNGSHFKGFVVSAFRNHETLDDILHDHAGLGYSLLVLDGGEEIYAYSDAARRYQKEWSQESEISVHGVTWRIQVWPAPELFGQMQSLVDESVLISGLLTASLLAAAIHFAQAARRRARKAVTINRQLEGEISQRKLADSALRESERRYRQLVHALPAAVYTCDAEGRITLFNEAAAALWGREPEIGKDQWCGSLRIYNPDGSPLPTDQCPMALTLRGGEPVRGREILIERTDGERFVVLPHPQPIHDASGAVIGGVNMLMDITERKRAEEALALQAAELARSNAELESFAYIASHDLQEPLRKVQAFGDRLKTKFAGALGDEGRDYLGRMQNAAARMKILVDDLLELSRVATKGRPFAAVDLNTIAREVISDLQARIEQTGGEVIVSDLSVINADPTQMRQLFQNLIGNALKFHREDEPPIVEIRCAIERPKARGNDRNGEWCHLVVKDNGIGFDPKHADRIFAPFQRLNGRAEYEGTGIGLAICRKIAERHGGSITAKSEPSGGATFTVTLPVRHNP
ncbi:MAG TPA: ATP-binding protein [Blastocatellia bacterium]|nr:ATP-binding protein [Blastocatellia bacterium]